MRKKAPGSGSSIRSLVEHTRRQFIIGATTISASFAFVGTACAAQGSVKIGIALGDIPRLWGGPDGGFQGMRFCGYPVYDALINWDLDAESRPSGLVAGLAESWQPDPKDPTRWIVKLRQGVKFHDGSAFDADSAVWNFASVYDEKAPQYSAVRAAMIRSRLPSVAGAEKIDDRTIGIRIHAPDAMVPYQLSFLLFASPAQYAKLCNDWDKFAAQPSGTGPFRVAAIVPRTRLELARNALYWDAKRVPKSDVTLLPVSDDTARVAALRAGQVDMCEAIPPDAIASLKSASFGVRTNPYPQVLTWSLSCLPDSPFSDRRIRQAANLAVNRDGIAQSLNGTALAAKGFVQEDSPWFGSPSFKLRYDPDAARKLLAAAGYGPEKPVKAKILMSNGGGGQMQPLQTNPLIQADLAKVGIEVEFQVVDFVTLFTVFRNGAKAPASADIHGISIAAPTLDPTSEFLRGFSSDLVPPRGSNWGYYSNPAVDNALHAAQLAPDNAALDQAIARVNTLLIDDAAALILAHDLNPWALSSHVRNFVQARNWFVNLTSLSLR